MALNNEQFQRAVELGTGLQAQGTQPSLQQRPTGYSMADLRDDLQSGWESLQSAGQKFGEKTQRIGRRSVGGEIGGIEATQQFANAVGKTSFGMFGESVNTALKAFAPQNIEEETAEAVMESMIALGVPEKYQAYQTFKAKQPEWLRTDMESAELAIEGILEAGLPIKGLGQLTKGINTVSKTGKRIGANVVEISPVNIRNVIRRSPEEDQKVLKSNLEDSLRASFIDDKPAVQKALDRVASRSGRNINGDDLIQRLAAEGVVPKADGEVSDFSDFFEYVKSEEARIGGAVTKRLRQEVELTPLSTIREQARKQIVNDPYVSDIPRAQRAIDRFLDTFETRYGKNLTPVQVNEIRKTTNKATKAFNKDDFELDAAAAVGNTARNRIDSIVKTDSVRAANSRLADLYLLRDAAIQLNRRKIDTGEVAKTLGSFMGTVAAGATGLAVAGPGGLVVAYLAARMGSKALSNLIRGMRFGDKNREAIIKALRKDPVTVRRLIDEAEAGDKEILERALLPAAGETSAGQVPIELGARTGDDSVRAVDAPKGFPRQSPETGRMERTFQGEARREAQQLLARLDESSRKDNISDIRRQSGKGGFFGVRRSRKEIQNNISAIDKAIDKLMADGAKESDPNIKDLMKHRARFVKERG